MIKATTKTTTTRRAIDAVKTVGETTSPNATAKRQRRKAATKEQSTIPASPIIEPTEPPTGSSDTAPAAKPQRQTKAALVRARLSAPGGVSLTVLIEATGWQAHTLRAYLSGLRKEGLTLTRRREGDDTIYAIDPSCPKTTAAASDSVAQMAEASGITFEATAGAASAMQDISSDVDDSASASHSAESNA